jgi:hypothetical protein
MKRLLTLNADPFPTDAVTNAGDYGSIISPVFTEAFTGRVDAASIYDLREATIEIIASAGGINEVIDAVQAGTFLAVTDADFTAYDPQADLELGYFYGEEPLVRATLTIQTVWIRAWYEDLIPPDVRGPMGLPALEGLEPNSDPNQPSEDDFGGGGRRD